MPSLRVIFMGTPELARVSLEALLGSANLRVIGVVTQPDRPKGRDLKLQPSPVKELALAQGLPVLQPDRARNQQFIETLAQLGPDLIAVAAYGQILPQSILDIPRFGCLNVHTSLLPKYRGAAPIQWAILNDDSVTGVTIMQMDAGMDTGPIVAQRETAIGPEDTSESLHDRLAALGAALLVETIPEHTAGRIQPRPQPIEGLSYAPKITKRDGEIDWQKPARAIWNRVRGLVPWPGTYTWSRLEGSAQLVKLWKAEVVERNGSPGEILAADKGELVVACGRDALRVLTLQKEGGRRLSAQEFLAGNRLEAGQRLG